MIEEVVARHVLAVEASSFHEPDVESERNEAARCALLIDPICDLLLEGARAPGRELGAGAGRGREDEGESRE
jgi:hypothetical protein